MAGERPTVRGATEDKVMAGERTVNAEAEHRRRWATHIAGRFFYTRVRRNVTKPEIDSN
jgi:hypothetical protein